MAKPKQISIDDLHPGKKLDFGETILSEKDIVEFATAFDPLDFHVNKAAAKKSFFKQLVASGPHVFNLVHRTKWIPLFGKSVICGLEITNWKFLKPVFANMSVFSSVKVVKIKPNIEKNHAVIYWRYEFKDKDGHFVQTVDAIVLHKI